MPRNKQRYILDVDDLLEPEFLTTDNANRLLAGLNASMATTPLAAALGGTGVISKNTFKDGKLLRYNAVIDKIVNGDLARTDLSNIAAGGDLDGYYPDPTIRDNAVIYDYMGTANRVTDVLNSQVVLSVVINAAGTGYTSRATATIDPPSVPNGTQATVQITVSGGGIVGTSNLVGGGGYTSSPTVTVHDPGAGGKGVQISKYNGSSPEFNASTGAFAVNTIAAAYVVGVGAGYSAGGVTATVAGAGSSAALSPNVSGGTITSFSISDQGTNYNATTGRPVLSIQDTGTGTGAWWTAKSNPSGQLSTAGSYYTFHAGGSGYSANSTVTVSPPPPGGVQATATLIISGGGAITGITVVNPGSGYGNGNYFTFTITDPGAGGSGANLTATVLQLPSSQGTVLLGAAPSSNGNYTLEWFPQPDFSFLDGSISPVTVYNSVGAGNYQYYTVPSWANSLQIEIFGPGGYGGSNAPYGTVDGGGGGGGSYVKLQLSLATRLNVLDSKGQIKVLVGQGISAGTRYSSVQFAVSGGSVGYNFTSLCGSDGQSGSASANPAGGAGGLATYNGANITSFAGDANVVVSLYGIGGPGNRGGAVAGASDATTGGRFGDGGTNGSTYLTANPALPNSPTNPRYQRNAATNVAAGWHGGVGATPGNGGGSGRDMAGGGSGGDGRVVITAFVATGSGTTTRLLVPKVMGLVSWSGSAATQVFGSNIEQISVNNTGSAVDDPISGTTNGLPAYTLAVGFSKPFALANYMPTVQLTSPGSATSAATVAGYTATPVLISTSEFQVTFNKALPGTALLIGFEVFGPV